MARTEFYGAVARDPQTDRALQERLRGKNLIFVGDELGPAALYAFRRGADVRVFAERSFQPEIWNSVLGSRVIPTGRDTSITDDAAVHTLMVSKPNEIEAAAIKDLQRTGEVTFVVGSTVSTDGLKGHEVWGGRSAYVAALEDKGSIGAVFDALRLAQPDSAIVPVDDEFAIRKAFRRLDKRHGVVAFPVGGVGSGAIGALRFNNGDETIAVAQMRQQAFTMNLKSFRMASFERGVSFGIGGFVHPNGEVSIAAPFEMLTGQRPSGAMMHLGIANTWRPAPELRGEMERDARRVGEAMHVGFDFAGWFSLDGIVTADGIKYLEVNPRYSASSRHIDSVDANIQTPLLSAMATAHDDLGVSPEALEKRLQHAAYKKRVVSVSWYERAAKAAEAFALGVRLDGYGPHLANTRGTDLKARGTMKFEKVHGFEGRRVRVFGIEEHIPEGASATPMVDSALLCVDKFDSSAAPIRTTRKGQEPLRFSDQTLTKTQTKPLYVNPGEISF